MFEWPKYGPLLLVIILTVMLRCCWVLIINPVPFGDADHFERIALSVSRGSGFSLDGETPSFYRQPGYPILLGVIYSIAGPSRHIAQGVNIIFAVLAVWVPALCSQFFP